MRGNSLHFLFPDVSLAETYKRWVPRSELKCEQWAEMSLLKIGVETDYKSLVVDLSNALQIDEETRLQAKIDDSGLAENILQRSNICEKYDHASFSAS